MEEGVIVEIAGIEHAWEGSGSGAPASHVPIPPSEGWERRHKLGCYALGMNTTCATDRRSTWLKAARFDHPDAIPVYFAINASCWSQYPQAELARLIDAHPRLFPTGAPPLPYRPVIAGNARADQPCTDRWGSCWVTSLDGIIGTVSGHPIADFTGVEAWSPPDATVGDSFTLRDWSQLPDQVARDRAAGLPVVLGLEHGHTFLRLCDLTGYEAAIVAMAEGDPRLLRVLDGIEAFNAHLVDCYVAARPDAVAFPEDLGMQVGPMLSPTHFRRYILPSYRRLIAPVRAAGLPVHMHSDGDIRRLAADLIDGGVEVLNLQDLVNGLDWIAANLKGRVCIDLDIDRQRITPFGTPAEIHAHIRAVLDTLADPAGGLMLTYGLYPGVPLANVAALMDALEPIAA
jgi:uroporphyrinogen decarboxylase